jgi:hypothetical protein
LGSAQESEKPPSLRRFPENQKFGLERRQSLRFQQQITEILVSAPAEEKRLDVTVDGFYHTKSHPHAAVIQNPFQVGEQHFRQLLERLQPLLAKLVDPLV